MKTLKKTPNFNKKNKSLVNCPHCSCVISNVRDLFYNQKYQCSSCTGIYFIVKDIVGKYM